MAGNAISTVLLAILLVLGFQTAASKSETLKPCPSQFVQGLAELTEDCLWQQQQQQSLGQLGHVVLQGQPSHGLMVAITVTNTALMPAGKPTHGFSLDMKRLVVRNATLPPPEAQADVPKLLPQGLFPVTPANLSLMDVRLVVSQETFQQYLQFFSKHLQSVRSAQDGGVGMFTDGASFLSIPYWHDNRTELFSVTLLSPLCIPSTLVSSPLGQTVPLLPALPGCNIRSVDNTTLVPTLLRDAAVNTSQALLIRVVSNVTLGPGLLQSIMIRRPVLLLGMASAPTSVDLGMVVNQLNVTGPGAQLSWQSLILENLAPGDSISSLTATPFSTTVSSNLWAVYCNRSGPVVCLPLSNVTLVVPSQEELNYQAFMYTMFNSPAPALRQMTDFYRTDLNTSVIQFVAGPGNDSMTILRLINKGWNLWYVVVTLRPYAAPKLPVPRQSFSMQKYRTGSLVQALQDCNGLQSALAYNSSSNRARIWTLINNVSIGEAGHPACPWASTALAAPTQLYGQVVMSKEAGVIDQHLLPVPAAQSEAAGYSFAAAVSASSGGSARIDGGPPDSNRPPLGALYSLGFGFTPALFKLPSDAPDKFLQIENITLKQLPQSKSGNLQGSGRRLMQPGAATPAGIWTILLWPFQRSPSGSPLAVSDSQLLLPEPEWQLLAQAARRSDSFVLQLQDNQGLTFTGVSQVGQALRVAAFQGPGISGNDLWLFPDATAAAAMPGYQWPADMLAASMPISTGSGSPAAGMSVALQAGIGAVVGALVLLALGLGALVVVLRRRHLQKGAGGPTKQQPAAADGKLPELLVLAPGDSPSAPDSSCHVQTDESVSRLSAGPDQLKIAAAPAGAAAAGAKHAKPKQSLSSGRLDRGSKSRSNSSNRNTAAEETADASTVGSATVAVPGAASTAPSSLEQSIETGLERWRAAVSLTTLQLMQRRMQASNPMFTQLSSTASSMSGGGAAAALTGDAAVACLQQQQQVLQPPQASVWPAPACGNAGTSSGDGLQLHHVIGTGSFGCVYLGTWRGKRVAIKVMHLPANALLDSGSHADVGTEQQGNNSSSDTGCDGNANGRRQQQQQRRKSSPHMAIMEAVLSSTMSHPNVVQVYTYMLTPLMAQPRGHNACRGEVGPSMGQAGGQQQQQQVAAQHGQQHDAAAAAAGQAADADADDLDAHGDSMIGWQLRLVMEWCDKGTLREALDKRRLPHLPGTTLLQPAVVLSLSHDIAAAMLHLHTEGIVHGDLKAGNVLLSARAAGAESAPGCSSCGSNPSSSSNQPTDPWAAANVAPLTAKVADFGLAMPLGPADTHATMLARGTPTHMSPELFMAGHVSKASDVYAYGILLYEIMTGRRAYAGVPIPLLPHEVALQGLRPEWPSKMPAGCKGLKQLAEACWAQKPQNRPTFQDIFNILEHICTYGTAPDAAAPGQQLAAAGQQPAGHAVAPVNGEQAHIQQQQQQPPAQQQKQQHMQQLPPVQPPAGLKQQVVQHPMQQQQQAQLHPAVTAAVVGAGAVPLGRRAGGFNNKDQLSWSEISYGGSRHDGGWA